MSYVSFSVSAPAQWEEALTMLLYAHGAPGLEIDDPSLIAAHLAAGDWDASVFDGQRLEVGRITLRALFAKDTPLQALYEDIAALSPQHERLFTISAAPQPEQNWQQTWRESFPTLRLSRSLVVMPYWRKESLRPPQKAIIISPGQAFGTGDHATTALCAELLEEYLLPGAQVADVGCGSGILAIAALRLGAVQALAIDNDPLCAASVAEHRALNGLTAEELPFLLGDIIQDTALHSACRAFAPQLVLANIVASVVAALAAPLATILPAHGLWILGGILKEKESLVREALTAARWQILSRRERQGWLAFCCRKDGEQYG